MTNKLLSVAAVTFFFGCSTAQMRTSPSAEILGFDEVPVIGFTEGGDPIRLGGFSALQFVENENNLFYFRTITDRGAIASHGEVTVNGKKIAMYPFLIPDFAPSVVDFSFNSDTKKLTILSRSPLKDEDGDALTGLPPKPSEGQEMQDAYSTDYQLLDKDELGVDSEGYCQAADFRFVSDEYSPALLMFDKNLVLEKQWTPGNGLPAALAKRPLNRGLEALDCDSQYAYMMLQSPLQGEGHIRFIVFDWHNEKTVGEFLYPVDAAKADKIGDMALVNAQKFVVIEQNGKAGAEKGIRNVYLIDLVKAGPGGELKKEFLLNLNSLGLQNFEKIEGITVVDNRTIALIMDNDFGLTGAYDKTTQKYETKPDAKSYFILVQLPAALF